jgi:hypothetical protein
MRMIGPDSKPPAASISPAPAARRRMLKQVRHEGVRAFGGAAENIS